ncbi:MAG: DUF4405 domain-containing protein [Hyphomicrobiales bacterium]
MFKSLIAKYATTFTTTLFAVSAVSGVFLFFHTAQDIFKEMHEWLSMVLLLPVAFHVYKNWRPFLGYFRNKVIYMPLVASLVVAVAFGWATVGGGGSPVGKIFGAMEKASISELAPIFDKTPDEVLASLKNAGFEVTSADETPAAIAGRAGTEPMRLIMVLTSAN